MNAVILELIKLLDVSYIWYKTILRRSSPQIEKKAQRCPSTPNSARDCGTTRHEPVFIGVVTDGLWEKFCKLFELDDLWADEALRENNSRVAARDRTLPRVKALIAGLTSAQVIARLDGTGMPFAPIKRPEDLFDDPQMAAGGLEAARLVDGKQTELPAIPVAFGGRRVARKAKLP